MVVIVRGDSTLPLEIPRNLLQPSMDAAVGMGYWLQWVYVGLKSGKIGHIFLLFALTGQKSCQINQILSI